MVVPCLELRIAIHLAGGGVSLRGAAVVARLRYVSRSPIFLSLVAELRPGSYLRKVSITLAVLASRLQHPPRLAAVDHGGVAICLFRRLWGGAPGRGLYVRLLVPRTPELGYAFGSALSRDLLDGSPSRLIHANVGDGRRARARSGPLLDRRILGLRADRVAVGMPWSISFGGGAVS
jgi:hypothetical protein